MFRASLCPKHVETEVNNKHLIVASCWPSLFILLYHVYTCTTARQTLYYITNTSVKQSISTTVNTICMGSFKQLLYRNKQNLLGTTEHGSAQNKSSRCAIWRTITYNNNNNNFINCKWVDTRWQWSLNMLHMYGLFALNLVVRRGLHGKHVAATWNIKGNLWPCTNLSSPGTTPSSLSDGAEFDLQWDLCTNFSSFTCAK